MALNFVRGVVSQDLKRHVEAAWDLNLTYILSNLIAMSYPGEGVEGMYRNDITQVAAYLDHKHNEHYMIFNLSERNYNFDLFHGRVLDFGWPDHHGPPLQILIDVVSNIDRWIRADPRNVAIVHCLAGRGRTGTAICAYLCYAGYFASMVKALQYYANVRSNKGKGVTQPSQLRYCKYIDLILNRPLTPKPKCVSITRVTITPVPGMTSQSGIRPILNIYRYAPGVQELIWTSQKDTNEATFFGPKDGEITFTIPDIAPIAGDIMIKLSHVTTWMWIGSKTEVIMRLIMNTSFFADGQSVITLGKRDLDIAHKDSRFAQNTQLFLYSSVIPDGPSPSKRDWDPEKFEVWAASAKENRLKLSSGEATSGILRAEPSSIIFHPFSPPEAIGTPPPTASDDPQDNRQTEEPTLASLSPSLLIASLSDADTVLPSNSILLNLEASSSAPLPPLEGSAIVKDSQETVATCPPSLSEEPQSPSQDEKASSESFAPNQETTIIPPESNVPAPSSIESPTYDDPPSSPISMPTAEKTSNEPSSNMSESGLSLSPEDMVVSPEDEAVALDDTSLETHSLS